MLRSTHDDSTDRRDGGKVRDALRVFRLTLIIKLAVVLLWLLFALAVRGQIPVGLYLRGVPALVLALLFLPPWLERGLGRAYLALGLGLDVLFSSLEMTTLLVQWPGTRLLGLGLPGQVVLRLADAPPTDPFFFLLIPLVLFAWAYGRRGALWGSTWAAVLHLGTGLAVVPRGVELWLFLAQASIRLSLLYLVPLLVSVLAERERRQHAELAATHDALRQHAATVEQLAASRERNRLARDLHDTLAHSLSALTLQLEALRTLVVHDPPAAREAVDDVARLARHGLEESRRAIVALRSDRVETMGLAAALRDKLQSMQARSGLHTELVLGGEEDDLDGDVTQTLYRIAEEALANAERHAGAGQVSVRLAFGRDRTDLSVQDDGQGFDPDAVDADRYGLTGMRERAAMLGADLRIRARPGGGTEVWCSVPRRRERAGESARRGRS